MGPLDPQRFNIFNISPVLIIFAKNIEHFPCLVRVDSRNWGNVLFFESAYNRGHGKDVKYAKSVGQHGASRPQRFKIFNISPL